MYGSMANYGGDVQRGLTEELMRLELLAAGTLGPLGLHCEPKCSGQVCQLLSLSLVMASARS